MKESHKKFDNKSTISRETFIKNCFTCGIGFYALNNLIIPRQVFADDLSAEAKADITQLHKAKYWRPIAGEKTKCVLCPEECIIQQGKNAICYSRGNRNGTLYSLVYARPSVISLDMVEKSPLYHFQIDGKVFSIATAGCNLACLFCQNWEISQVGPDDVETFELEPEEVINRAKKHNINSINFFYTEPTVYFEYMLDIAKLAKKENMKTFCVTAGYINSEPLNELIPFIDAFVLGLKGFDDDFYKKYIGCSIEPIKDTLKILAKSRDKTWFEIVNLLIPDLNDDEATIKEMCRWLTNELGNDVPLHFTRFEPSYKMTDIPPTPISTLENAYKIAKDSGIHYVYLGNLPGHKGNNTFCPGCNKMVIERVNYTVIKNTLKDGKCACGYEIPGHWL